jgi:hypothetical protein
MLLGEAAVALFLVQWRNMSQGRFFQRYLR